MEPTRELLLLLCDSSPDAVVVADGAGRIVFTNQRVFDLFGWKPDELLDAPVEQLMPSELTEIHQRHRSGFAARPSARAMGAGAVLTGRHRNGTDVPIDVSLSPITTDDGPMVIAAVRHARARLDVDKRMRSAERLFEAISDAVIAIDAPTLTVAQVNGGATRLLGAEGDLIGMPFADLLHGWSEADVRSALRPLDDGRVTVLSLSVEFATVGSGTAGSGTAGSGTAGSGTAGSETVAVDLAVQTFDRPGAEQQYLLVARDVAVHRRLERDLRAAQTTIALTDERDRIARDLHDGVIQRLYAAGLHLQVARGSSADPTSIDDVIDEIDRAVTDIRSTVFALHTPRGLEQGFDYALRLCVAESERVLGHTPEVELVGPLDSTRPEIAGDAIDVVRELLVNVAKHARSSSTKVSVRVDAEGLTLEVTDWGVGVEVGTMQAGQGLHNLRARAERNGGTFDVWPRLEGGTTAHWHVPDPRPL
jgi:PAS domain S-box-containing protein